MIAIPREMLIRNHPEDYNLAPYCYNRLPLFEDQTKDVSRSTLEALANIFLRYNMHTEFGISLLHRHCATPSNSVMVHSRSEEDICIPQELGLDDIRPCQFFFSRGHGEFLPLEFERAGLRTECIPSQSFLSELASFLRCRSLDNVLGLSRVLPLDGPWIEFQRPDGRGTVAVRSAQEAELGGGVITEWAFLSVNGVLCIKAQTECVTTASGVHEPPPPPPPKPPPPKE